MPRHLTYQAATPPEADALADRIDAMPPRARITEVMHEVSRATGFTTAFTNLRTGERCENENALLATILADASNLGLTRMAAASQGVTRDQLAGGEATTRAIAAAFLALDQSQLDYYEVITKRMPGSVLRRHGIVEYDLETSARFDLHSPSMTRG